jgi:hypothetical protein
MRILNKTVSIAALFATAYLPLTGVAQEVMFDQFREVAGLTVFPVYGDNTSWYYLPRTVQLARDARGNPQFSFLKFRRSERTEGEGGVTRGEGGGVLNFLVTLDAPENQVRRAESQLAAVVPDAVLKGPIAYHSGNFMIYTTAALGDEGEFTAARQARILGVGKAPLMAGSKAAVGVRLSGEDATIMWESFDSGAADLSVMFDMMVRGFYNPAEGRVEADWRRIASNETIAAGLKTPILGADVMRAMKELESDEAIVVRLKNTEDPDANAQLDRLTAKAYDMVINKVLTLAAQETMATLADDQDLFSNFERAAAFNEAEYQRSREQNEDEQSRFDRDLERVIKIREAIREDQAVSTPRGDAQYLPILDLLPFDGPGLITDSRRSGLSSGSSLEELIDKIRPPGNRAAPAISILASYRTKSFDVSGTTSVDLSLASVTTKPIDVITENVGGLASSLWGNEHYFREVNFDDPAYLQRELLVSLDGQDVADFEKFVNFVVVSLKKTHQNGDVTVDELKIDKNNYQQSMNAFRLMYGYHQDFDRDKWMQYEYRVVWNLFGGIQWESDWQTGMDYVISVVPPHVYREITVEANSAKLQALDARHVTVRFTSNLLGRSIHEDVQLRPSGPTSTIIKYAHVPGDLNYEYDLKWRLYGGEYLETGPLRGEDDTIYADEVPKAGD